MLNKKLFTTFIALFLVSTVIALTGVIQIDTFFDSSTGEALTGVRSLQFTCNDNECNDIGTQIFDLNSGNTNQITFEYPFNPDSTESNQDFYAHYFFKQCYLPKEFVEHIWGFGATLEFDYNFNKASSCHSPIDSFSITNSNHVNEPVVINVKALLEADAHSAFTNLLLEFIPAGFESFYSAETKVTLEIINDDTGEVVFTESETFEILVDTSQNVQFEFTPTVEGDYTARIKTKVIDCQCQSNFEQFSERNFVVLKERAKNQCYTIINDLEAVPEFAEEGNDVTIRFNKISNFADNSFVKTPVETRVTYEITDSQNNIVFSDNLLLDANTNGFDSEEISFNFIPDFGGDFNIKVTGISESSLCDGKTNTKDTAILGFFVKSTVVHKVTFLVSDSQTNLMLENAEVDFGTQTGNTDSSGKVVFNSNPGNFGFTVSLSGYDSKTGTEEITGDTTIKVKLELIEITAPMCGNNIIETGEQCDDGNLINEDGCSNICEIEDDDDDEDKKKISSRSSICINNLECTEWSSCVGGLKTRSCSYSPNQCEYKASKPIETITCISEYSIINLEEEIEEEKEFSWLTLFMILLILGIILSTTLIIGLAMRRE